MKIKTKKQLNLPQLIEWAWENDVRGKRFETITQEGPPGIVHVTDGRGISIDRPVFEDELFTVEVEETVTEDTVIPEMLEISLDKERGINLTDIHRNQSINDVKSDSKFGYETLALHVINDDCTHTLIWTSEKGLVE